MPMQDEPRVPVLVWDLPIRLFHWLLTLLFLFQLVTGIIGGALMKWHLYSGYAVLTLLVFRILWGFAGSTHARFASFVRGPRATLAFARRLFSREAVPQLGHNPLGGWMVMALIAAFTLQAVTGLFAFDGVSVWGPLASLVSPETSNRLSEVHDWNVNLLMLLVMLHVAASLFHLLAKGENLITPMITGIKRVPAALLRERREARRDAPLRRVASREPSAGWIAGGGRALALLAVSIALVAILVTVFR
jgi:cytochrome b